MNKIYIMTFTLIGSWIFMLILGLPVIKLLGAQEYTGAFLTSWILGFAIIMAIPGVIIMKLYAPRLISFCKSYPGTIIIGIVSAYVIAYSSGQANLLIYSLFKFNPKYLPVTDSFVTITLTLKNWLTLFSTIAFVIALLFCMSAFALGHVPRFKPLFNKVSLSAIGMVFWGLFALLIPTLPILLGVNIPNTIKIIALNFDYYPSTIYSKCASSPYQYTRFTWLGGDNISVYDPKLNIFEIRQC